MKRLGSLIALALSFGCGDDGAGGTSASDAGMDSGLTSDAGTTPTDGGTGTSEAAVACAAQASQQARVACAANALLATLTPLQKSSVNLTLTDYLTRSKWSNLPVELKPRAGAQMSSLSATSQAAVLDLMNIALNDNGRTTMNGILRADDYLKTMAGGYGSTLYSVAVFGTPAPSGDFEIMFGGHHMAYNLNFVGGSFYPVPQHLGCEPKSGFEVNGETYAPMAPKGDAMFAIYESLDTTQRTTAQLSGTFADVVGNPDLDYGKGESRTSKAAYPIGSNRKGVIVSNLSSAQQARVTAAIEQWARQYPPEVADALMTAYTGAYSDTYFAWGGAASGPTKDTSGSYLRIDGPRVWIELAVQGGVVIRGETHYHTIYHDKTYDYGMQF